MQCAARAGVALSPWDVVETDGRLTIDGMDAYRWIAAAMQGRTPVAQQQYEDVIVARAAELYRQWEARPWHAKLRGRIRGAWCALRIARKGWGA